MSPALVRLVEMMLDPYYECLLLSECEAMWHLRWHQFWQCNRLGRATLMVGSLVKKLVMTNSGSENGRKRRLYNESMLEIGKKHDI